jgi:branched-chain amino acid transport system ATP-binding protein
MTALSCTNLHARRAHRAVLNGATFSVDAGSVCGIVGLNGAGKSTLLDAIQGVLACEAGSVLVDGREIGRLPTWQRARMGLGRTHQLPNLMEHETVVDNIALAGPDRTGESIWSATVGRRSWLRRAEDDRARAAHALLELELSQDVLAATPNRLSFGQRKAVCFARALVAAPRVILFDEPFAGMAPTAASAVARCIRRLADQGAAIVLVEHNFAILSDLCTQLLLLDRGVLTRHASVASALEAMDRRTHRAAPPSPHATTPPAGGPSKGPPCSP